MAQPTTITELLAYWNSGDGKPYKGRLIDYSAYKEGNLSCMCAQGQVLYTLGGWSVDDLCNTGQAEADLAVAKALNISRAHAILLRNINDTADGAPSIVLTDPGKVLGDQWSKLLDFGHYMDGLDHAGWQKVDAAGAAAGAASGTDDWAVARDAAWDAARAASRDAAWGAAAEGAAKAAAWVAVWEIQGAAVLSAQGRAPFFLPMFGFASFDEIPARPANYGGAA